MKVLVIGGGIMGSAVALELAEPGTQVTVLERAIPGAEASSAAGGMLAPQAESAGPGPMMDLGLRSRGLYPAWVSKIEELAGTDVGYRPSGLLQVGFTEAAVHALDATVAWQKALGLRIELLSGDEARAFEPGLSPKALAAAYSPDDHQVDARKLLQALSMAAARSGVSYRTGYVRGIVEEQGRAVGVDLDGEVLRADAVVLAAGSWSGLVAGAHIDPRLVRPARGQMVELQLRLPPTQRIMKSGAGYVVPRADGRVIAGSTMEHVGYDKAVTGAGLLKVLQGAIDLCPALAEAQVVAHWAGLRPWTEDALPLLGEGPLPGLTLATGHFRNGILLAPITARAVAGVIRGAPLKGFDLSPFRYSRFSR